jgi:hypothetical protein
MKKNGEPRSNRDIQTEYDFSSMQGGVRGKYYERYRKGTNVVLLEPDIAEAFPTEGAVNEALRGVLGMTRAVRRTGGLPDHSLQNIPSRRKRRGSRA